MIARYLLLALLPIVAGVSLTQSRRLSAIIGMGLFSFLLAAVYLLMHAPDVAITEATIGAALVTAIYILAIRRTGRLTVVADEVTGLMAREGHRISGLEYEILEGFATSQGLDLSIQFVPLRRVPWLIAHHEADIGAGGLVPRDANDLLVTPGHLETGLFGVGSPDSEGEGILAPDYEGYFSELIECAREGSLSKKATSLDLGRVIALNRHGATLNSLRRWPDTYSYAFLVDRRRVELHRELSGYVSALQASGKLEDMIRRHVL
jgi:uncharacterized MnhB-related membrane protein